MVISREEETPCDDAVGSSGLRQFGDGALLDGWTIGP